MRTPSRVFALVATAIAFGASFFMLQGVIGIDSPWLGLLAMFYFLGLAKVGEPLFALRVPKPLQRVRPWERSNGAYQRLAVPGFGRLLRQTPLRYLNPAVYLARSPGGLG